MDDEIKAAIIATVSVILFIALCVIGSRSVQIAYIDNVTVIVKVEGKTVYQGPSVGVTVTSSGANTTVVISGGFLYFFPKACYVSNHVEVVGKK